MLTVVSCYSRTTCVRDRCAICIHQGAKVWKVNGYIDDCGKIVGGGKEEMGWFDTSTLKEPYRIEGKKTMGLELAEQFGFDVLPDGRVALPAL